MMARVVVHQKGVRWQRNDSTDSDHFFTEFCGTDILSWIHSEQADATLFSPIKILIFGENSNLKLESLTRSPIRD
jgi:hypothetical protein